MTTFTGSIDYEALRVEILAAIGGEDKWNIRGEEWGMTFEVFDPSVVVPTALIEAHIANAPMRTMQRAKTANTIALQAELDRVALAHGYDNIVSACSYAAQQDGAPFQAEGAAFLTWRSAVWMHAYDVLAQVQAGAVPMPTPTEAVLQMPALILP